ncbi:MAG: MBL fold metallo-hydrolase [candidate division Zixibacteria bacterium]|nr:MBL fold metallo-hydrolase [candidate division Zixibacteria bacterium]MDD5426281.1 MBL fold metallo-hydrolase [candidate division Zixibacteria bacterium]
MRKVISILTIVSFSFMMFPGESIRAEEGKEFMDNDGHESFALDNLRLEIVYDNNSSKENIKADWGFGCFITGAVKTILFDTGAKGDILLANMRHMHLEPKDIELIFISHDHWDHTGGLRDILPQCDRAEVYMLQAFSPETKRIPQESGAALFEITASTSLGENIYTTGQMGKDIKEQALVFKTKRGLVIVTGCAHPGIVEITRKVKEMFPDELFLVIGGFHLVRDSEEAIGAVIEELKSMGVRYAAPCHCSGDNARRLFKEAFGDNYIEVSAGLTLDLSELK